MDIASSGRNVKWKYMRRRRKERERHVMRLFHRRHKVGGLGRAGTGPTV
jgi:hypothetical protein